MPSKAGFGVLGILGLAICLPVSLNAQDKVANSSGRVFEGRITGVANGTVQVQGSSGLVGVPLNQVRAVEMKEPTGLKEALKALSDGDSSKALALVTPIASKFAGLPTPWAKQSTRLFAELNLENGNLKAAEEAYINYEKLYAGDPAIIVGKARLAVAKNELDLARELLTPVLAKASEDPDLTGPVGQVLSQAYLVDGMLYEAKGELPQALESYLTTVTIFTADAASVTTARAKAEELKKRGDVFVP